MLPAVSVIIVVGGIELLARAGLLPVFVPSPSAVLMLVYSRPRLLYGNLWPTTVTALMGYGVASVIALGAAAIASMIRSLYTSIYNFGVTLQSIPIIATAPLLALWLGTGPSLHITIAALTSQFAMLVGAMQGFRAAEGRQRELLHALSATPFQTFRLLVLPSALPYLFAGLKVAAPSAVLGAVTAEWAGADRGLGAMMLYALFSYDTTKVWLSVMAACLLAASGYGLVALAERYFVFWTRETELAD
jgi:ABC-type nitrate/sulfonate/bicarbonate transport system permease component